MTHETAMINENNLKMNLNHIYNHNVIIICTMGKMIIWFLHELPNRIVLMKDNLIASNHN